MNHSLNPQAEMQVAFAQNFDKSRLISFIKTIDTHRPVGEGVSVRSYHFENRSSMDFAVNLLREGAFSSLTLVKSWKQNLSRIRGCPLVPPFEIIAHQERVALVMPFGDEIQGLTSPSMISEIKRFREALFLQGLVLGDLLQIRTWRQIPFVHDFSDLLKI